MKIFFILSVILTSFFIVSADEIYAHQPYEIKNSTDQTIIELSDATVSHAYYGEFFSDQEEVIFDLKSFSAPILQFSILIPDKSPENIFSQSELPEVKLITESQDEIEFLPYERIGFYEPYSRMNLIRVITYKNTNYNWIYNDFYSVELSVVFTFEKEEPLGFNSQMNIQVGTNYLVLTPES